MTDAGREVTTFQKLSYGVGEFFNATTVVVILMLFLKFLTDVVGLTPFHAGLCIVAGKAWDAVSDPLIGNISDRTRSRFGRRRIYFLIFAIPASVSFVAMWLHLELSAQWATMLYYALAYITFKTFSSLLMVPYQALGPELATGYDERTSIIVYRMVFTPIGAIVAGVVPNMIIRHYDEAGEPGMGHLVVSLIFGAVYIVIWFWVFAALRERPTAQASEDKTPFLRSLRLTMRNRSFRILVLLYLCAFLAVDILTASTKYFIDEYLGRPELMPAIMGSMLGTAMLSLPVYFQVIKRLDRKRAYMIGTLFWTAGLMLLFSLSSESSSAAIIGAMIVIGVGIGAAFITPWSMVPEVIDVEVAVTGRSEEGVYTGIMTFLRKATTSLAIFGIATSLEVFGYRPPAELAGGSQPASALTAIHVFTALIPIFIVVLSTFVAWRYPITKRGHALIRKKIEAKDDGELSREEAKELDELLERAYGFAQK